MAIVKIGFDFDKVFVDYPPIIPSKLVTFCYRYGAIPLYRNTSQLSYRIPGPFEKRIRLMTHVPILRPAIPHNILALRKLSKEKGVQLYLISGRFDFLRARTEDLLHRYKLKPCFKKVYFDFENEQPHLFKLRIIKKEKIEIFVDDDFDLLKYLSTKAPGVRYFWITKHLTSPSKKITPISDLGDFNTIYMNEYGK